MGHGNKCHQMASWVTSNKKVLQGEKPSQEQDVEHGRIEDHQRTPMKWVNKLGW